MQYTHVYTLPFVSASLSVANLLCSDTDLIAVLPADQVSPSAVSMSWLRLLAWCAFQRRCAKLMFHLDEWTSNH